jgi:uncharacterized alkaline shock family protein YloU
MAETETTVKNEAQRLHLEGKRDNGAPGGMITLGEEVVATIAGLAAREVEGIHSLGRWRLIPFGDNPTRGIDAEVGQQQAALDLDVVIEYGSNLREVATALRAKIASEVDKMAGRQVVEVNINVVGLHVPDENTAPPKDHPRVI